MLKLVALFCVVACALPEAAAAVTTMSVIDIAPGIGTEERMWIAPLAINNAGQIVGTIDTPEGSRGFVWDNGVLTTIGYFGSSVVPWPGPAGWSSAHDINDLGQVVGTTWTGEVFLWENGRMSRLPGLEPCSLVFGGEVGAAAINNAGQVVGRYYRDVFPNEDIQCFVWQDGVVTELDRPGVWPSEINDLGVITGSISQPGRLPTAFVWKDGVFTEISEGIGSTSGYGRDINNAGQVVGVIGWSAFLWQNGVFTMLGGPGYIRSSSAQAINEVGQVVGALNSHACIWQNGVMTDLNSLVRDDSGWLLREAMDINESGDIVGYGFHKGEFRQFLYTAVDHGIAIDVRPGDPSNTINLKSKGVLPVAVLASPDYPISSISASTISFAGAKAERYTEEDVDGDGDQDLLFHFRIPALKLDTDSTSANLIGRLSNGTLFVSSDVVDLLPPKSRESGQSKGFAGAVAGSVGACQRLRIERFSGDAIRNRVPSTPERPSLPRTHVR